MNSKIDPFIQIALQSNILAQFDCKSGDPSEKVKYFIG